MSDHRPVPSELVSSQTHAELPDHEATGSMSLLVVAAVTTLGVAALGVMIAPVLPSPGRRPHARTGVPASGATRAAPVTHWSQMRRRDRCRRARAVAALPDAIDMLISCLQAGMTPLLALDELRSRAPLTTRPAWQAAVDRLHRGEGFAEAIDELVRHCGPTALPFVTVLSSGVRDGLPLLPLLDRLTIEADARRRRAAEAEARKLPVRLAFPLVCCTLPAFVLLAIVPALLGALTGLQLPT